mmetsp:Transcript_4181/g.5570  ORF Transcript_4181/g.5570 Transcript_4181/m.5570 type:complete len:245 (-) Transcript_4181:94-828(-)
MVASLARSRCCIIAIAVDLFIEEPYRDPRPAGASRDTHLAGLRARINSALHQVVYMLLDDNTMVFLVCSSFPNASAALFYFNLLFFTSRPSPLTSPLGSLPSSSSPSSSLSLSSSLPSISISSGFEAPFWPASTATSVLFPPLMFSSFTLLFSLSSSSSSLSRSISSGLFCLEAVLSFCCCFCSSFISSPERYAPIISGICSRRRISTVWGFLAYIVGGVPRFGCCFSSHGALVAWKFSGTFKW